MAKKTGISKKRVVNVEAVGQAHVSSTFNNIIISMTNNNGEVISWSSAGKKASVAQRKILRMLLRQRLKSVQKLRLILVCAK